MYYLTYSKSITAQQGKINSDLAKNSIFPAQKAQMSSYTPKVFFFVDEGNSTLVNTIFLPP